LQTAGIDCWIETRGNEFGLCDPVPALLADADLEAGL
jgi:hypothetical protein